MNTLRAEEKLKIVRDLCEKHKITAYEIGEKTKLDISGIQRILNGDTKKPREKTLDTILNYLDSKIVGSAIPGHLNFVNEDTTEEYAIISAIKNLEKMIRRDNDLFAKALEISILDTKEIKETSLEILLKTNNISGSIDNLATTIDARLGRNP